MKKWLFAILFGSALVLGACGGGDDDASNNGGNNEGGETASAAEEIYEQNCTACHGADLSGGAGPDLTAIGADYSADELVDIIQNGIGGMPAQNVNDADAQTLADWLAEKK